VSIERYDQLAAAVLVEPPGLGPVRLVAVDGPAGSGKTTFARRLTAAVAAAGATAAELHTDDLLEGWTDMVTFWPRLREWVLDPLRAGRPARYRRYDWEAQRFSDEWLSIEPPDVLVVEGVSSVAAVAAYGPSRTIFVHAEPELRLTRGIERDGEALRERWLAWMADEDRHFHRHATSDRVDLNVDGAPRVAHDPEVEYVRRHHQAGPRYAHAHPHHGLGSAGMSLTEPELRAAVAEHLPAAIADLRSLVTIPGIAFDGFDHSVLDRSAAAVVDLLRGAGVPDVRVVREGGAPAVIGRRPGPPGAPTVLLYAHHDVQPPGDRSAWKSDPFEAVERDGRLYGRGAADDKAGIMAHVTTLRAFGDRLPVGVTVFVEGEEEFGSASLRDLLVKHRDELASDVIVIADSGNWAVGQPALTTSLRGIVNLFVDVHVLDHEVHSGMFGGPVPDALIVLARLLATMHDDQGDVAVDGLVRGEASPLDLPEQRLRNEAGMLDGVSLIGSGRIVDRLWNRPAISVLGIDAPATAEAPNALVGSARAKISVRIAPGDSSASAFEAVHDHVVRNAPWGARVTVTLEHDGDPFVINATGPAYDAARSAFASAWDNVAPVDMGVGGSIPFIATFAELFPDAAILVTGVEDPDSRAHGANESLHLAEFGRACLAEVLLLRNLADGRATSDGA
jgi:acetylornithine deacetylase/succinyl-diaminopimelate desuccinylase-like protein